MLKKTLEKTLDRRIARFEKAIKWLNFYWYKGDSAKALSYYELALASATTDNDFHLVSRWGKELGL